MKRSVHDSGRHLLEPERFSNEPVYCEATAHPDDLLCSGSEDDAYETPAARRIRYEAAAQRYIHGYNLFVLSAALRGPLGREHGWTNPWRSRSRPPVTVIEVPPRKRQRISESDAGFAEHVKSSQILGASTDPFSSPKSDHAQPCPGPTSFIDEEAFGRIQSWRDAVIPGSSQSPAISDKVIETASAEPVVQPLVKPRPAKRPSLRSRAVVAGRDSAGWTSTITSSVSTRAQKVSETRQLSSQLPEAGTPLSRLHTIAEPPSPSRQTQSSQKCSKIPAMPPSASSGEILPLDMVDVSPRAAMIYEQIMQTDAIDRTPQDDSVSAEAARTSISKQEQKEAPTPRTGTAELVFQTSSDRSFRFRRKTTRNKSKPAPVATRLSSQLLQPVSGNVGETKRRRKSSVPHSDPIIVRSHTKSNMESPKSKVFVSQPEKAINNSVIVEFQELEAIEDSIVVTAESPESNRVRLLPEYHQTVGELEGQAIDLEHSVEDITAKSVSPIDGPTLVYSKSPSESQPPSRLSRLHFSAEKQCQNFSDELARLPRKLLWPSSQKTAKPALASILGISSPQPLASSQPATVNGIIQPDTVVDEQGALQEDKPPIAASSPDAEPSKLDEQASPPGPVHKSSESEMESKTASDDSEGFVEDIGTEKIAQPGQMTNASQQNTSKVQSPWAKDVNVLPQATEEQLIPHEINLSSIAHQALAQASYQSPWRTDGSQLPVLEVRPFNPISSPADSAHLVKAIGDSSPLRPTPSHREDFDMTNSQLFPAHPSTPETKLSSLPTPESTMSIRSFKEFLTPSPRRPAKRARTSMATNGQLPSTQLLFDAAISNPWGEPSTKKRKTKHVSWAPLPGEESNFLEDADDSIHGAKLPSVTVEGDPTPRLPRVASPPPLISKGSPLGEGKKFAKHFAAMANRRVRTPVVRRKCLLPSASQQTCGSPAVDAMATAFIEADEAAKSKAEPTSTPSEASSLLDLYMDGNIEGQGESQQEAINNDQGPEPLDDVSAVLLNINDFLDTWDVDAELDKARNEQKNNEAVSMRQAHQNSMLVGAEIDGLLDVGVWD
ncbi:hypothetical protein B0H63DRAFT_470094 [Podospora didyma]|uniref:Protamine P1 n=1 Tax=Podospora didyma TaxID=330526 RepID=A0AAE0NTR8_9PEZI|nr:hypothetical protein B0H63DRAFT_470094 [Podospora didyma]